MHEVRRETFQDEGFINGLAFPTAADLVCLFLTVSCLPFGQAKRDAKYVDQAVKFPKLTQLSQRTAAAPGVKEYLAKLPTIEKPLSIPKIVCRVLGMKCCCCCCDCTTTQVLGAPSSAPATAPEQQSMDMDGAPELLNFPFAGQGELARLIAAAGGLDIKSTPIKMGEHTNLGFFGSLPILKHGSFSIAQSSAIETYCAEIAPKFKGLSPKQRAMDEMFSATKEDMLQSCAKYAFGDAELKKTTTKELAKALDKDLGALNKFLPASGFINGFDYPTTADLVLVNFAEARVPFGAAMDLVEGGYDWQGKYPKIKAIVDSTKEATGVKEYLAASTTLKHGF